MATKYISLTNLDTFLGQLKTNYKANDKDYGGIKIDTNITSNTDKKYAVQLDDSGKAYVNVPWTAGENYELPVATSTALGGVKIGYNSNTAKIDSVSIKTPLLLDNSAAYVSISTANTTNAGLMSGTDKKNLDSAVTKLGNIDNNANNYTHPKDGANTGTFGQPTTVILTHGGTFSVPYVTVNNSGHVTAISTKTLTLPEAEGSSGGGGGMVSISYAALKTARDNGELVPGTKYRINNYKTTVGSGSYNSTEKQFDIIVEALSECELSENAKACWHTPYSTSVEFKDYHFSNSDLSAWELKYCIDNDDNKFEWANKSSGTGVIYYMKDEWGNEAPYDFKNIRFKNSNDSTDTNYFFTFSKLAKTSTGYSVFDASTIYSGDTHLYETMPFATHNVIKPCYTSEYPVYTSANTSGTKTKLQLNRIVCVYTQNLNFNDANHIVYNNYFDTNCNNIWILGSPYENKFGKNCRDIEIGGPTASYNNFGNNCTNIKLAKFNYKNTNRYGVGSGSAAVTYSYYIQHNNFGNNCSNIVLGESCSCNTFGNNCGGWEAGKHFVGNKIGNNCCAWVFGNYCSKNVMIDNNYTTKYGNDIENVKTFMPDFGNANSNTYAKIMAAGGNSPANWVCDCYFGEQSHAQITLCTSDGYNYPIVENFDKDNVLRFVRFTNLTGKEHTNSITAPPDIKILGSDNSDHGGWANLQVMRLATYNEDASNGKKYELTRYRLDYY